MKERRIFVFCDGGLGNRLNSLIGGLVVAESYNLKPIICWPENNWCGCSFEDLFDNEFNIMKDDVFYFFKEDSNNLFLSITDNGIKLKNYLEPNEHGFGHIKNTETDVVYYHNKIPKNLNQEKILKFSRQLQIKSNIVRSALEFVSSNNISKSTKGLHIRRRLYFIDSWRTTLFIFVSSYMSLGISKVSSSVGSVFSTFWIQLVFGNYSISRF